MASTLLLLLGILAMLAPCPMALTVITDCTGLQDMNNDLTETYELGNDIDCSATNSGAGFLPVGTSSSPFRGKLDGKGYVIQDLFINRPSSNYVGLFASLGSTAQVNNTGMLSANITGSLSVGSLAGENLGSISNCYTTGNVMSSISNLNQVGGLVGNNAGIITNCTTTSSVMGTASGYLAFSNIGGLVGSNSGAISNSYATGSLIGTISGLYSSSDIGGLVGSNSGTISNSYATGSATNSGDSSDIGGLVGSNHGSISNSYATGSMTSSGDSSKVGGLVAQNLGAISNSYATGSVTSSGDSSEVGGLVGTNSGTISNSYATGSVMDDISGFYSYSDIGGLVGYSSGSISNSYATGSATNSGDFNNAGGLVGSNSGTISNSYATGSVTNSGDSSDIGGLLGHNSGGAIISNGYWDTQTSGQTSSAAGTGKNTIEMHQQITFEGWDFNCTWTINEGSDYPHLTHADCGNRTVLVSTCTELQTAVAVIDVSIILAQDIDCSDTVNWNNGAGFLPGTGLTVTGAFNGNGYLIISLVINRPDTNGIGLFSSIGPLALITSVNLVRSSISGNSHLGGLAGRSSGSITNCTTTGSVMSSGSNSNAVGGLAGYSSGVITNCTTTISVMSSGSNSNAVGGLVGRNLGTISNCTATGSVMSSGSNSNTIGGLAGYNDGIITNSYATGSVISSGSDSSDIGGLVGYNRGKSVTSCTATGSVMSSGSNSNAVGGLVGCNAASISSSHSTGNVTGSGSYFGGLVGLNSRTTVRAATINASYSTGNINGKKSVGGLVGSNGSPSFNDGSTITNSYATGNVSGDSFVGGLAGSNPGSSNTIIASYATGHVSGTEYIGGLVGNNKGVVSNSHSTATTAASGKSAGGLVGSNEGSIIDCLAAGTVSGNHRVGGLAGDNFGTIQHSQVNSRIDAEHNQVGGLVGSNFGLLTDCSVNATVSGQWVVGGLVGLNYNHIDSCHVTINLHASGISAGGLIGLNQGTPTDPLTIFNCTVKGSITGADEVGGLIGDSEATIVKNCSVTALTLHASGNEVGGLIGESEDGNIENAYVIGEINAGGSAIGGLVGQNENTPLSDCFTNVNLIGTGDRVGGLVGFNLRSTVTNSWTEAHVEGAIEIGGLVGRNDGGTITDCYAISTSVSATSRAGGLVGSNVLGSRIESSNASVTVSSTPGSIWVGGLVGANEGGSEITNCKVSGGPVSGTNAVGGLVGINAADAIINGCSTNSRVNGVNDVGGLVGRNDDATVTNSSATGAVTAALGDRIGGLIGFNKGTIAFLSDEGTQAPVSGRNEVGGLIGHNEGSNAPLVDYRVVRSVSGQHKVGGLVGNNQDTSVLRCHTAGEVSGSGNEVGGLIGLNSGMNTLVNHSTATGVVTGENQVGGLIGNNINAPITNSSATGEIVGAYQVGGLIGRNSGGGVNNCSAVGGDISWFSTGAEVGGLIGFNNAKIIASHAKKNTTGRDNIGGLIGSNAGTILHCYATGNVGDFGTVGGLIGHNTGAISDCHASGMISGSTIGGLIGSHDYTTVETSTFIEDSYATGEVNEGYDSSGGLIGELRSTDTVRRCYATGDVSGSDSVGGLIGHIYPGNSFIHDCYATGKVKGKYHYSHTGGLIGDASDFSGTLQNSYAVGCVDSNGKSGGLIGSPINVGAINITNSYWDKRKTGQKFISGKGSNAHFRKYRKSTDNLYQADPKKNKGTYDGWDFENVWLPPVPKKDGAEPHYPTLRGLGGPLSTAHSGQCRDPDPFKITLNALAIIVGVLAVIPIARSLYRHTEQGKAVYQTTQDEQLPLMAHLGEIILLEPLLKNASPEAIASALVLAAGAGHVAVVQRLKDQPSLDSDARQRALDLAARRGHRGVVTALLTTGGAADQYMRQQGWLADRTQNQLFEAAKEGKFLDVFKVLWTGADPNLLNEEGLTPLMLAVKHRHLSTAMLLIEWKADIFIRSPQDGKTVLDIAHAEGLRGWAHQTTRRQQYARYWKTRFTVYLEAVKSSNPHFTGVDLGHNALEDYQLAELCQALCGNKTVITLNVASNNISTLGVRALGKMLKENNTTLKHIDLHDNLIDYWGVEVLAMALASNHTVQHLDLTENEELPNKGHAIWTPLETRLEQNQSGSITSPTVAAQPNMPHMHALLDSKQVHQNRLLMQRFQVVTIVAYLLEISDKVTDMLMILELYRSREETMAYAALASLLCSYLVAFTALRMAYGRWWPTTWQGFFKGIFFFPVISPEMIPLKWGSQYVDINFARLKFANFLLEDLPQFIITVHFLKHSGGENNTAIMNLALTFTASTFFLLKLVLFDLPNMRMRLKSIVKQPRDLLKRRSQASTSGTGTPMKELVV